MEFRAARDEPVCEAQPRNSSDPLRTLRTAKTAPPNAHQQRGSRGGGGSGGGVQWGSGGDVLRAVRPTPAVLPAPSHAAWVLRDLNRAASHDSLVSTSLPKAGFGFLRGSDPAAAGVAAREGAPRPSAYEEDVGGDGDGGNLWSDTDSCSSDAANTSRQEQRFWARMSALPAHGSCGASDWDSTPEAPRSPARPTESLSSRRGLSLDEFPPGAFAQPAVPVSKSAPASASISGAACHRDGSLSTSPQRFRADFEALEDLGRGAFGRVIKVVHMLDRNVYAVKKLRIHETSQGSSDHQEEAKILREVSTLSRLSHPNIVRYFQAWIERERTSFSSDSEDDEFDFGSSSDESEDEAVGPSSPAFLGEPGSPTPYILPMCDSGLDVSPVAHSGPLVAPERLPSHKSARAVRRSRVRRDKKSALERCDDCQTRYVPWAADIMGLQLSPPHGNPLCQDCFKNRIRLKYHDKIVDRKMIHFTECRPEPVLSAKYLFIQMEYCDLTLAELIGARVLKPGPAVWSLFQQILQGLCYVHNQGIIHRDLKPANIFLSGDSLRTGDLEHLNLQQLLALKVKIGDFGLSKAAPPHQGANPSATANFASLRHLVAKDGASDQQNASPAPNAEPPELEPDQAEDDTTDIGTFFYTPPEANLHWDRKADMYALGIVLFEMLCRFDTGMERLVVLKELRKRQTTFPAGFEAVNFEAAIIIRRLLLRDAKLRPSADELLAQQAIIQPVSRSQLKRSGSSPSLLMAVARSSSLDLTAGCPVHSVPPSPSHVSAGHTTLFHREDARIASLLEYYEPLDVGDRATLPFPHPLPVYWQRSQTTTPIGTPLASPEPFRRERRVSPSPASPRRKKSSSRPKRQSSHAADEKSSGLVMHLFSRLQAQEDVIAFLQRQLKAKDQEVAVLHQLLGTTRPAAPRRPSIATEPRPARPASKEREHGGKEFQAGSRVRQVLSPVKGSPRNSPVSFAGSKSAPPKQPLARVTASTRAKQLFAV